MAIARARRGGSGEERGLVGVERKMQMFVCAWVGVEWGICGVLGFLGI